MELLRVTFPMARYGPWLASSAKRHTNMNPVRSLPIAFLLIAVAAPPQSPPPARPERPTPPTRDPHTAGYVAARELPDGSLPPANDDGNFILGPTHPAD